MLYKRGFICSVLVMLLCVMLSVPALAAGSDNATKEAAKAVKERTEIEQLSEQALERLYERVPSAQQVINNSYAYATLSNTGMKLGIFGSAHGRGVAINNQTGERVYMRMSESSAGLGFGVKEYDLIFVIADKDAWDSFTKDNWKVGGSAEAAANDGEDGDSIEGAVVVRKGIWVYQMTKKGLSLEATIKGTNIYPDEKLNMKL
ncbi:MAG: hypothetical protein IKR28_10260 [Selenomonadaceae bacterium]|nr:hypothetical protein [Selenomonadaceae bacterium]